MTLTNSGNIETSLRYDAFGKKYQQSGAFTPRYTFSTKEYLSDAILYLYAYRVYDPIAGRWTQRDPIDYQDSENLYQFCGNNPVNGVDPHGKNRYITQFDIRNLGKSGGTQFHVGIAVDTWEKNNDKWIKTGQVTFDFRPKIDYNKISLGKNLLLAFLNLICCATITGQGEIEQSKGLNLDKPVTIESTPEEDQKMLSILQKQMDAPPRFHNLFYNCVWWSVEMLNAGIDPVKEKKRMDEIKK